MRILYLHGVGLGDPATGWLKGLNRGLASIDAEPVSVDEVIAPQYRDLLKATGIESTHPPVTYDAAVDDRDARRAFERRQGQVELLVRDFQEVRAFGLGRVPDSVVTGLQESLLDSAPLDVLKQVKNYLTDAGLRGAVLQRILDDLVDVEEVVLIGHSLGSVIAIDLLDHLPATVHVRRLITIGSPAGTPALYQNSQRILARFPYSRVDDWSNFLDPLDGVTAGRGLATIFPGAQDFSVRGASTHRSYDYLSQPAIATLVDRAVHPGADATRGTGLARRLTDDELTVLVTLRFADAVGSHIPKRQTRERYQDALSVVRDLYVSDLTDQADAQHLPPELATLADGKLPRLPRIWDLSEVISRVVVLAYSNLVAPYEIDTGDAAIDAISSITQHLGYPAETAAQVCAAVESVNEHLDRRARWLGTRSRWALAAAGVTLLAAGPVGLAVAGGVGVAGAAVISGGLATASTASVAAAGGLAMLSGIAGTAGMVAAAAATARPGPKAVVLDPTSIAIQVAVAHALQNVGEEFDDGLWERVVIAESELSAQINRLEPFSDPKAPSLEQLRAARDLISSLLSYLKKHRLAPEQALVSVSDPDRRHPTVSPSFALAKPISKILGK
ncbi:hypothetical protein [Gordonia hydrophobica]|uniref:Alpha/beta hydrolase n=1 Tax=Gordonia hydrophobica TaxID=40516 RepID=A0ABZ2TYG7_9ACTN|nr:hypothetical protein [Gordonia hydrophobica]MBM7366959.1 pimeloyl-ACP methyl ester carboxylesterase [Gordonia hydrophobica]